MHIIVPSCCCLHIRSDFKINQLTITSLLLPLLYPHCKLVNHQPLAHDSLVDSSRSVHYSSEYNCTMPPPRAASAFLVQQTTGNWCTREREGGRPPIYTYYLTMLLNSIQLQKCFQSGVIVSVECSSIVLCRKSESESECCGETIHKYF